MFRGNKEIYSNFYPCRVRIAVSKDMTKTMICGSIEAAFQACKSTNPSIRRRIGALSPAAAKKAGRLIQLRPDWDAVKDNVMLNLLRQKFSIAGLQTQLIAEDPAELVEFNYWHDCYWGVCKCKKCKDKPKLNRLGELLRKVREEKQNENR